MVNVLTQSMVSTFQTCRKQYDYRYNKEIVPVEESTSLGVGSAVHAGLEMWFRGATQADAVEMTENFPGLSEADQVKSSVLVSKYIDKWRGENRIDIMFDVVDVEKVFEIPLINPDTRRKSRQWLVSGKVDGIVRMNGKLFILEHKTSSSVSDEYIMRISIDRQIMLYARAIEMVMKEPVVGAVYDVLIKSGLKMRKGETDEEFAMRRAELIAKSKTGTTTAKQKTAETYDEFKARVSDDINQDNFFRRIVTFDPLDVENQMRELWGIAKDIRSGMIYKSTSQCCVSGRNCPYLLLCVNGGDITKCQDEYKYCKAHSELDV